MTVELTKEAVIIAILIIAAVIAIIINLFVTYMNRRIERLEIAVMAMITAISDTCSAFSQLGESDSSQSDST